MLTHDCPNFVFCSVPSVLGTVFWHHISYQSVPSLHESHTKCLISFCFRNFFQPIIHSFFQHIFVLTNFFFLNFKHEPAIFFIFKPSCPILFHKPQTGKIVFSLGQWNIRICVGWILGNFFSTTTEWAFLQMRNQHKSSSILLNPLSTMVI